MCVVMSVDDRSGPLCYLAAGQPTCQPKMASAEAFDALVIAPGTRPRVHIMTTPQRPLTTCAQGRRIQQKVNFSCAGVFRAEAQLDKDRAGPRLRGHGYWRSPLHSTTRLTIFEQRDDGFASLKAPICPAYSGSCFSRHRRRHQAM
jgi:hypothetical protein